MNPGDPAASPSEADRLARVVLSRAVEPGDLTTASLMRQMSPPEVVRHQSEPKPGSRLDARLREVDPCRELEQAERQGIRFVIPGDAEWPQALRDLDEEEVELQAMGGMPPGLWVRGPMPLTALTESVAIVGSRASTVYGERVAGDLAAVVARAGSPVVSGAAYGVDYAAHRGARGAHGPTAAVLACGVDRAYPVAHKDLLTHLAAEFAVISEVPPGSAPTRPRFLARNRLIAALTRGTVVVEAAIRSGALNTAHWAEQLSRPVMGVPGPVGSAPSEGVHHLIRIGGATLVTHGLEVLEMVGVAGEHLLEVPRGPSRPRDVLCRDDQQILEVVPAMAPAGVASIAGAARMHVREVDSALRRMARHGLVEMVGDSWRLGTRG